MIQAFNFFGLCFLIFVAGGITFVNGLHCLNYIEIAEAGTHIEVAYYKIAISIFFATFFSIILYKVK